MSRYLWSFPLQSRFGTENITSIWRRKQAQNPHFTQMCFASLLKLVLPPDFRLMIDDDKILPFFATLRHTMSLIR